LINATSEQCGTCHQGEHHPYFSEWQQAMHSLSDSNASPFLQNMFRTDPNCSGCHTYQGFLQFVNDTALAPNVTPPGANSLPIVCVTCHDPHSAANTAQLRIAPAALCQKCHNPEYSPDSPTPTGEDIHHATAHMLEGKGGYEFAGYTYEQSMHKDVATDKCVTCHIVRTPFSVGTPASTGHTFLPKAVKCAECHGDFDTLATTFNYRNVQSEIDSLLTLLGGNLGTASSADSTTFNFKAAKFNYDFVNSDGSRGIHNTAYARGLLLSAILNFTPTGVILVDPAVPEKFSLGQNYPNPFNPTTKITVNLPARGSARLNIYSITGELVATLMNGIYDAGTYDVTWNGLNISGTEAANGVYLYRFESGNFTQTKKMMLMK
jgi:predicted CXXCH cytochrome family protein